MKSQPLLPLVFLLLALLAAGCASTRETEQLLSASGFKIIPAATPEQKAQLKTVRQGAITMVQRGGKVYFVYPNRKLQVLYVGRQEQYDHYQELRFEQKLAQRRMRAVQMGTEAAFSPWSGWSSVGFVEPVPGYGR
jgi:hypothetical protein